MRMERLFEDFRLRASVYRLDQKISERIALCAIARCDGRMPQA